MDLLLDTHPFIWFLNGDEQLPQNLKSSITDTTNKCFLSIASLWEIAINGCTSFFSTACLLPNNANIEEQRKPAYHP